MIPDLSDNDLGSDFEYFEPLDKLLQPGNTRRFRAQQALDAITVKEVSDATEEVSPKTDQKPRYRTSFRGRRGR